MKEVPEQDHFEFGIHYDLFNGPPFEFNNKDDPCNEVNHFNAHTDKSGVTV